ncbi:MAG: tRNA uridine-5-carboxymethylaminomethyl(34) synthesis GTPase MnmE [Rhodocyclaceae bacterium]|nr:tRNA uridine-5-carboxymethylaminomethyl(34) synthesis GTPase MnmE [Rhodocyclaceae bacterium]
MDREPVTEPIAAIATAPGRGGIGVVRVSGRDLHAWFIPLLGRVPLPRTACFCGFLARDRSPIDQGIALYFPAPHSFTGEDVLELQGHGGPVVMQLLLRRCVELGARLADAGEFTKRAFLNDKIDLAQAEAVADLIEASTVAAARSAVRSLVGEFSALVHGLEVQLIELRMLVEACLDFPEEEVDFLAEAGALDRLGDIGLTLEALDLRSRRGSVLRNGLHVVLVGRPNVGKSSLLNCLAGEDLSIVTDVPGTTRDAVRQNLEVQGVPLHVVDTAGLRETEDPVERLGIERTWTEIGKCDLVVYLVDAALGVGIDEEPILARLPTAAPRLTVHNKADLTGCPGAMESKADGVHVWVSAKTGAGMDTFRAELLRIAGVSVGQEDGFLARERHLVALKSAREHAAQAVSLSGHLELFAEELRLAHRALGSITGEYSADDLLGDIFSRFCIGK